MGTVPQNRREEKFVKDESKTKSTGVKSALDYNDSGELVKLSKAQIRELIILTVKQAPYSATDLEQDRLSAPLLTHAIARTRQLLEIEDPIWKLVI